MQQSRLAAAVLVLSCLILGCDGITQISGVVKDSDGVGISGAQIHVEATAKFKGWLGRARDATTTQNGEFDIDFTHRPIAGEFDVTVTHPGFSDFKEVLSTGSHTNHVIELKRLEPKPDEAKAED